MNDSTQGLPVGDVTRLALVTRDWRGSATAISRYLGIPHWAVRHLPAQAGQGAFTSAIGRGEAPGIALELIQPADAPSPWQGFLERNGEGMSHLVLPLAGSPQALAATVTALGGSLSKYPVASAGQGWWIDTADQLCQIGLWVEDPSSQAPYGRVADEIFPVPDATAILPVDRLYHVGTVVRDRDRAQAALGAWLGYRDWVNLELHTDQGMSAELRGRAIAHHARVGFSRGHDFSFEVMEPGAGEGLYQEFLATRGEGMQHFFPTICSHAVFEAALPRLHERGWQPLLRGDIEGLITWYYLDTGKEMAGLTIEIICPYRQDWLAAMAFGADKARMVGIV